MTDRYQVIREALPALIAEAQAKGGRNERAALIVELLEERDALQAEVEALRAEVVKLRNMRADAIVEHTLANVRAERLAEALRDAATSMQTIADKAGRDEYLMTTDEVRGYANSRANAARAALAKEAGRG